MSATCQGCCRGSRSDDSSPESTPAAVMGIRNVLYCGLRAHAPVAKPVCTSRKQSLEALPASTAQIPSVADSFEAGTLSAGYTSFAGTRVIKRLDESSCTPCHTSEPCRLASRISWSQGCAQVSSMQSDTLHMLHVSTAGKLCHQLLALLPSASSLD